MTLSGAYYDAFVACFSSRPPRPPGAAHGTIVPFLLRWAVGLVAAALLLGACSDGEDGGDEAGGKGAPPASEVPPATGFAVVAADVHAMAPQAPPFPEELKAAVKAGLDAWLGKGISVPLGTGKPPEGLEAVFTAPALSRLAGPGPDRAALLEEGSPLTGKVSQDRANANLSALTAPGGEVVVVTAAVDLALTVASGDGAVAVVRSGELVLVPENGSWRIDAYDLRTSRDTQPGGRR